MAFKTQRKPLDMQAMKRVMSNQLYEAIGANRIRPSMTPSSKFNPQTAEILGKTLGELQDFRDLAHDESLKVEQTAREATTEKKSIRDRITEIKAKIEYKKHLLSRAIIQNKSQGRYEEEVVQIEGRSATSGKQANRILKGDAEKQRDEVYRLRDKILSVGSGGTTVPPQVKMRIEERMAELEATVDRDLENNMRRVQKHGAGSNFTFEETKYTLREIK